MRKPKFQIGDVVKFESRQGTKVFEIAHITDCEEKFRNDNIFQKWAYGAEGTEPKNHIFERFLTKVTVTKLEKSLL